MKVELIKQTFETTYGTKETSFKYKPFEWCCEEIKNHPLITLDYDNEGDYCYDDCDGNCDICVAKEKHDVPSITLERVVTISDYDGDYTDYHYYTINYCPFCGKPIEISIVSEEDVSETYQNLQKERDKLCKKRNKTDSIKKQRELGTAIDNLSKQINWFNSLSEYHSSFSKGGDSNG